MFDNLNFNQSDRKSIVYARARAEIHSEVEKVYPGNQARAKTLYWDMKKNVIELLGGKVEPATAPFSPPVYIPKHGSRIVVFGDGSKARF